MRLKFAFDPRRSPPNGMRHSPHQLISGRNRVRTKVPHASLRGQRGSKEDGTHLQNGVFQPIVATVTHPPWIGIILSFMSGVFFYTFRTPPAGSTPVSR